MKDLKFNLKTILLIAGLLFVCFSYYVWQIFFTPNFLIDSGDEPTVVLIPTGGTINNVKDSLDKYKIIHDRQSFYFLTRLLNYNEKVKPGRYIIQPKMTNIQVIRKLKRGEQDVVKVTFNNIRLRQDLIAKLSRYLEPSSLELDSILKNQEYVSKYGFDTNTILNMFIPDTYEMYWNTPSDKLFKKMEKAYKKYWNEERLKKAKDLGLTPNQVSILASIVEEETQQNSEKPRIAGVYLNRLKLNMPLQADPTLKFSVGDFTIKRVLDIHKQKDSPYNTYMYLGLPPGPINLPSTKTIDAVLNAEKHDYIFFCASPITPGFHDFSVTYNDHINNANRYRKFLDKINIK